jgi:S-formylglutathione hydrolase FrmB
VVHTRLEGTTSGLRVVANTASSTGLDSTRIWGSPTTQAQVWAEHNPYDLAGRLRGVELVISAGTGQLGPLDDYGPGTHSWPYRERALHRAMPRLLAGLTG